MQPVRDGGARHQATAAATARGREKKQTRQAVILAALFVLVLVLHFVLVEPVADGGAHHHPPTTAAAGRGEQQKPRKVVVVAAFLVFVLVPHFVVFVKPPGHSKTHEAAAPPATSGQQKLRQPSFLASRFEFTVLFEK